MKAHPFKLASGHITLSFWWKHGSKVPPQLVTILWGPGTGCHIHMQCESF